MCGWHFRWLHLLKCLHPKRPIWMGSGDKSGWDACYCYIYLWLGTECQMAISLSIGKFPRMLSKSLGSNILLNNRKNMAVQGEKCADNDAIPLWRLLLFCIFFLKYSIIFLSFSIFFLFGKFHPEKRQYVLKTIFIESFFSQFA